MEAETRDYRIVGQGPATMCQKYEERHGRTRLQKKAELPCETDPGCDGSPSSNYFCGMCRWIE